MLHTTQPSAFIHESLLANPSVCPDCKTPFQTGLGFVFNVPYRDLSTKELRWGLMCFCSPRCILDWTPCDVMGRG